MAKSDFKFRYPKRVRYAEIDAQAILFNSRYLEYFDIGITEYWRAVGMYTDQGLIGGAEFHVAKATVNYRAPIMVDELIDICVRCERIGTSSMTFLFELHGAGEADDLRATGEEISVHVAAARGKPAPVPQSISDRFARFEARALQQETVR